MSFLPMDFICYHSLWSELTDFSKEFSTECVLKNLLSNVHSYLLRKPVTFSYDDFGVSPGFMLQSSGFSISPGEKISGAISFISLCLLLIVTVALVLKPLNFFANCPKKVRINGIIVGVTMSSAIIIISIHENFYFSGYSGRIKGYYIYIHIIKCYDNNKTVHIG